MFCILTIELNVMTERQETRLILKHFKEKVKHSRKISLNGSSEDEFSLDMDLSKLREKQGRSENL